jgi:Ankyrin repeat
VATIGFCSKALATSSNSTAVAAATVGATLTRQDRVLAAVTARNAWVVEALFMQSCPVNNLSGSGFTPLHAAAGFGDIATVRVLLNMKVDINAASVSMAYATLYKLHQAFRTESASTLYKHLINAFVGQVWFILLTLVTLQFAPCVHNADERSDAFAERSSIWW